MSYSLVPSAFSSVLSMTSKEVAELTGKRHDNVLRDIDNLLKTLPSELGAGFSMTYEGDPVHGYRLYTLDRNSTLCLITGYDASSRMKIVKRWQELEAGLTPRTYIEALKALVASEEEKEAAIKKLEAEKPYAEVGHLVTSKDVMTRRDWVALMKTDWGVKIKEHSLNQFLQDRKYIYLDQLDRRARAYAQYDRYFKLDLEPINGLLLPVLKITGEGVKELTPIVVKHFSQQA